MDYLRYFFPSLILVLTALGLLEGGFWVWTGVALFALMAVPDMLMDFDFSERRMEAAGALFMLFVQLIPIAFLWIAYWLFLSAHPDIWETVGAVISVGVITAAVGLPVGHEMFHRSEPISRFFGSLVTSLLFSSYVDLEHRKSHHVETSSVRDVDTPRRGESVYPFAWKLFLFFHIHSYRQEKKRMEVHGKSVWFSPGSRVLWQILAAIALPSVFYFASGLYSVMAVLLTGLLGTFITTAFSYVQHYGLLRVPDTPIEKRHAWNHTRPISRMMTFEIVTHSQHHIDPSAPYWKLPAFRDAPLVGSAIAFFLLSLAPPLWHKVMRRHLERWDSEFANSAEKELARQANITAGWAA